MSKKKLYVKFKDSAGAIWVDARRVLTIRQDQNNATCTLHLNDNTELHGVVGKPRAIARKLNKAQQ